MWQMGLQCEDFCASPSLTETQHKLTAWETEHQSHRKSQLCLQYQTNQILKCIQPYCAAVGHHQYAKAISLFLIRYGGRKINQKIGPSLPRHMSGLANVLINTQDSGLLHITWPLLVNYPAPLHCDSCGSIDFCQCI